jgi:hypothetical protein
VIGDYATIGYGATVNSGAVVCSRVNVGDCSTMGSNSVTQNDVTLGTYCDIAAGAVIWDNCVLQDSCSVGASAVLQSRAQVGAGASVAASISIAPDYTIAASANVTTSVVTLYLASGGTTFGDGSGGTAWASDASAFGCAVCGDPVLTGGPIVAATPTTDVSPPTGGWGDLEDDIGNSVASWQGGGDGEAYVLGVYDCNDFAEDLRAQLAAILDNFEPKYETTFTIYNVINPDYSWQWCIWTPMYLFGHCLTDIHWPDGTTTWVDGEFPGMIGVNLYNEEMDGDGDGKIEYAEEFCPVWPTDGDVNIRVYGSREEAEMAGEHTGLE